jgi:hypothetical protein
MLSYVEPFCVLTLIEKYLTKIQYMQNLEPYYVHLISFAEKEKTSLITSLSFPSNNREKIR